MAIIQPGRTALLGLAAFLTTAACADDVTSPTKVAPVPQSATLAELEAAYDLVPGAPVQTEWTNHTPIPDSSWILVEIRGTIGYSRNPHCYSAGAKGYCDAPPLPIETGGPWGPLQAGALAGFTIQYGSQPAPNSAGHGNLLYSPTDDPASEIGRRLFYNALGPGKLWARREVYQTYAGSPTNPTVGYWPVFVHSGEQVLKVQVVPTPLRIDGPAFVPPGEPGTWTATIVGDFRLREANRVPAVQWEFFPGDTFATHNRSAPRETVALSQCSTLECTYIPYTSGRMVAWTYVEGQYVNVASQVFRLQNVQLELKCNGAQDSTRVTRADRVRCEVTSSTDIVGWDFVADGGAYRSPAEGATPFKGTAWEGPMVLSGAVTVRARIGSIEESKTVRVVVAPREWDALQMPRALSEEQPAPDLPTRPAAVHDLGHIHQGMELDFGRDKWEAVLSGPNANLAYLVTPPASYRGIIHVNRIALSVGSDFWNAQHTRQRTSGVVHCLQREQDIVGAIPVILRHEGIGFDSRSHAHLYVTEAERVGNPRYEQVVGATLAELADKSEGIRALARGSAVIATARADSTGYAPQMCRFHFNYRGP